MSSSITPPPNRPARPVGATSVEAPPRRRRWVLWLLLGLLALAAVAFAISRLTGNPDATAVGANPSATTQTPSPVLSTPTSSPPSPPSPTSPSAGPVASGTGTTATASAPVSPSATLNVSTTTAPSTTPAPGSTAVAAAGTISSTGIVLLGATDSTTARPVVLAPFVGKPAVADAATVQSVPADEGFWVGTSPTNRIWVQLTGGGESPETVTPGSHVSFTGTVTANPAGFAAQTGVDDAEGAGQLTTQGAHIAVATDTLKLSP